MKAGEETCVICFEEKQRPLGCVPICGHSFCWPCIEDWARMSDKCPLCKAPFTALEAQTQTVSRVVPLVSLPQPETECYVCRRRDQPHRTLVCEVCERKVCHMRCLNPPLKEIPHEGEWFCDFCVHAHRLRPGIQTASIFSKGRVISRRMKGRLRRTTSLRRFKRRLLFGGFFRSPLGRQSELGAQLRGGLNRLAHSPRSIN